MIRKRISYLNPRIFRTAPRAQGLEIEMKILNVKQPENRSCLWISHWEAGVIDTDVGCYKIPRWRDLFTRIAAKFVGTNAPTPLAEALKRLGARDEFGNEPEVFLPMIAMRPSLGEASITGLFETHWKSVPLDLVVFEDRWEVSLREDREYRSGYYSYSRIFIASILEVRDRETGQTAVMREVITPKDDGPNRFQNHLGDKVSAIRVIGDRVDVKTRFGVETKIHYMKLCSPNS